MEQVNKYGLKLRKVYALPYDTLQLRHEMRMVAGFEHLFDISYVVCMGKLEQIQTWVYVVLECQNYIDLLMKLFLQIHQYH